MSFKIVFLKLLPHLPGANEWRISAIALLPCIIHYLCQNCLYKSLLIFLYNIDYSPVACLMKFGSGCNFYFRLYCLYIISYYWSQRKFCACQDSCAVLVCAKFCCDRASILHVVSMKFTSKVGQNIVSGCVECCNSKSRSEGHSNL